MEMNHLKNQELARKRKKIAFYQLSEGKNKFDLKARADEVYTRFQAEKYDEIPELTIDGVAYYISAIQKLSFDVFVSYKQETEEQYCYAVNIANVNSSQQIKYGDLSKVVNEREEVIDLSDDNVDMSKVGPLSDTQFLIDPFYAVIAMGRTIGGTNMWALKKFLSQLFSARGIRLAYIPDTKGIDSIDGMSLLTSISYKVSKTGDVKDKKKESRSEMGDIKTARELEADDFEVRMKATSMNKGKAKNKIKSLFSMNNEFDKVESIQVEGIQNGQEVLYDLIKNKLCYRGNIEFDDTKGVTIRNNFDYLSLAYDDKLEFIRKNLTVRE